MSHTLPPLRGEGRVWGSSNPPHSCQPPPERGVDDGDGADGLTQATLISSRLIKQQHYTSHIISSTNTQIMPARSNTTCVLAARGQLFPRDLVF